MADSSGDGNDGGTNSGGNDFHFSELTLEQIRQLHSNFVQKRDWQKFHQPRNILLALFGELGEISELFQWKSDQDCSKGLPKWSEKQRKELSDELADVLIYLIRLADRCKIDLSETIILKN